MGSPAADTPSASGKGTKNDVDMADASEGKLGTSDDMCVEGSVEG